MYAPRPGGRAARPVWQYLLTTRSARLCLLTVGVVAMLTYVWLVVAMHPAHALAEHEASTIDVGLGHRLHMSTVRSGSAGGGERAAAIDATSSSGTAASSESTTPPATHWQLPKLPRPPSPTARAPSPAAEQAPLPSPEGPRPMLHHPHNDTMYRLWKLPKHDTSPRCAKSGICDGVYECGEDKLGCVRDALERKNRIREAARWTWKGYRQFAWGHDELNAGSRNSREWFRMGLTIVDSLDTLQLLGLLEEYGEARHWVANHLDFNQGEVSVFETTIRILGGLASAYYHSGGDELFLEKAVEFADRLLGTWAFPADTPAG
ncbi:Endoplasmic reticulum mannosyl-oligosaccharide 1,2-alpha-mannosidase [Tetrabaena socialis]|uniref:alpha-1,2-Mannosidase n=1 Tax=Tetrabaena socialis TaxID=47790 RepID=A0A2J7ZUN8_9CHLO|nr:Endoplasmic reticulum mannosyl-oligosaccharide 1,2-alpha-mannosidase [Tetrabaena socialis]|eukprot:PNH03981.1 Endoplasmic reticulum mannosyl-oligosaccharide 1,2-alpha-mannosidase [Tetrabaena socialis]